MLPLHDFRLQHATADVVEIAGHRSLSPRHGRRAGQFISRPALAFDIASCRGRPLTREASPPLRDVAAHDRMMPLASRTTRTRRLPRVGFMISPSAFYAAIYPLSNYGESAS